MEHVPAAMDHDDAELTAAKAIFTVQKRTACFKWRVDAMSVPMCRQTGEQPMKSIVASLALLAGMVPAAAEVWVCTFPGLISRMNVRERMEVRANEVIRDGERAYRIIENNARGLVATYARTQPAEVPISMGTLGLNKPTGDFVISVMVPGEPLANKVVAGKCQKEN
jgi:hypothetical protein